MTICVTTVFRVTALSSHSSTLSPTSMRRPIPTHAVPPPLSERGGASERGSGPSHPSSLTSSGSARRVVGVGPPPVAQKPASALNSPATSSSRLTTAPPPRSRTPTTATPSSRGAANQTPGSAGPSSRSANHQSGTGGGASAGASRATNQGAGQRVPLQPLFESLSTEQKAAGKVCITAIR